MCSIVNRGDSRLVDYVAFMAQHDPPVIAMTPWRRSLPTFLHPETDLYTLAPYYTNGVAQAGALPLVVPWLDGDDAAIAARATAVMYRFDGLVLTGGTDVEPDLYGTENLASHEPDIRGDRSDIAMMRAAIDQGKPVLAICRGVQIANVAFGGTLHQHIWGTFEDHPYPPRTGETAQDAEAFLANRHNVDLDADSTIATLFGATTVATNSMHHQSVDALGDGLRIVGQTADGIVEAIEHDSGLLLGVQWHPERLTDDGHQVLFDWLVRAATK